MKRALIALFILAAVALVALCAVRYYAFAGYGNDDVRVEIPAGTSDAAVEGIFTSAMGRSYGSKVYNLWRLQGGTASGSHGSYLVKKGQRAVNVARSIAKGRQTPVRLTFNNLRTVADFAGRVSRVMEADSLQILEALAQVMGGKGLTEAEYAAGLLPDTYEFYWTASPTAIIERLAEHRNKFWTEERRAKAAALGLTPEQVHTLASIVEEETTSADERPVIARLYLNRLSKGMMLQACPTVKFALGRFDLRRITGEHMRVQSPYNTYTVSGLPPGPIRIAEGATIDAVLNAPEHNYLYMCASSDFSGRHDYAETYDRHRINAARYHAALDRRGIK